MTRKNLFPLLTLALMSALLTLLPRTHAANQEVIDCGDNGLSTQLRAKINAANASGGGTITFKCGPSVTLLQGVLPTITTNITIDGGGTITISGNNASRIFVTDTTLTLNNITLSHGYVNGDDGGAIRGGSTLNINNSKFLNNTAEG